MGNCGDGGIPFAEGTAGDGAVSQLRAYGPDELYRAVRDRSLYFSGFWVGLEPSGCFLERIGLSCLYGYADSVQPLLAEGVSLWTDGVVVEDRNLYEMAAVGTVNSLISPIVIVVVINFLSVNVCFLPDL